MQPRQFSNKTAEEQLWNRLFHANRYNKYVRPTANRSATNVGIDMALMQIHEFNMKNEYMKMRVTFR